MKMSQVISQDTDLLPDPTSPISAPELIGTWYPDKFFNFSTTEIVSGGAVRQLAQLTVNPAQFIVNDTPTAITGRLRTYSQLVLRVKYLDPEADDDDDELQKIRTAPVIENVQLVKDLSELRPNVALAQADTNLIVARVTDTNFTQEQITVTGVYNTGSAWLPVTFTRSDVPNVWVSEVPVPAGGGNVLFYVEAANPAGRTTIFTGKGQLSAPEGVPLTGATLRGDLSVIVGTPVQVAVDQIQPINATRPFRIRWSPVPESGQGQRAATFRFNSTGPQTITATIQNVNGLSKPVTATFQVEVTTVPIGLTSVTINGSNTGLLGGTSSYSAAFMPANATAPITYTWEPTPTTGQGTPNVSYTWSTTGTQTVRVTAQNRVNSVSSSLIVTVAEPQNRVYLPLIVRALSE